MTESYTSNDYPSLSYVAPNQWTVQYGPSDQTIPMMQGVNKFNSQLSELERLQAMSRPIKAVLKEADLSEEKPMAKLVRYTVVNPDKNLLDVAPELAILHQGLVMMKSDERGFLMDLALELKGALEDHNTTLRALTYDDTEGKPKPFKAVKLANLDVCIEVVKEYK